jgi:hypothetical protein
LEALVHKLIKAAGTCFAAATIALVVAPAAGASTTHTTAGAPVAGISVPTASSWHHHCWRHHYRCHRDDWDGWDDGDYWDGGYGYDNGGWGDRGGDWGDRGGDWGHRGGGDWGQRGGRGRR